MWGNVNLCNGSINLLVLAEQRQWLSPSRPRKRNGQRAQKQARITDRRVSLSPTVSVDKTDNSRQAGSKRNAHEDNTPPAAHSFNVADSDRYQ